MFIVYEVKLGRHLFKTSQAFNGLKENFVCHNMGLLLLEDQVVLRVARYQGMTVTCYQSYTRNLPLPAARCAPFFETKIDLT